MVSTACALILNAPRRLLGSPSASLVRAPPSVASPGRERSLGTKPVRAQGVEREVDVATALTRARKARLPSPWTDRERDLEGRESEKERARAGRVTRPPLPCAGAIWHDDAQHQMKELIVSLLKTAITSANKAGK